MSWIVIVVVMAVCMPMLSRGWHGGRRPRGLPAERERLEALEAELDERLETLHRLEQRVAELENRLDFAERALVLPPPART